jgi:hypothetical protein
MNDPRCSCYEHKDESLWLESVPRVTLVFEIEFAGEIALTVAASTLSTAPVNASRLKECGT